MRRVIEIRSGAASPSYPPVCGIEPLAAESLVAHAPAVHLVLLRNESAVSRCSIWTERTPPYNGHRVGLIGHYAAANTSDGVDILNEAMNRLRADGCTLAIAPMDGNTWRRYRLVTWRGSAPTFFLEPDNPDEWPGHFTEAGFVGLAHYTSALNTDLARRDPRVPEALDRFSHAGLTIRQIDIDRFDDELRSVHRLSVTAFAGNFLYTPIDAEQFLEQYRPIRPHLRPELVLIAEDAQSVAGFIFAVPDLQQARRGATIDTAVIKSLAVHSGRRCAGLGSVLMDQCHQAAHRLGFRRVIHALMHESNTSQKISMRSSQTIRRYTLYAKGLDS